MKKSPIIFLFLQIKKDLLMNQADEDNESEKNKEKKETNIKKYTFFDIEKIIGNHNDYIRNNNEQTNVKTKLTAEFTMEINNRFISGGTNKYLYKYNKSFIIIDKT
jgi:polyribonucleotide nucleotidyltransferase